jgi:hypothetical protein
MMRTLLVVLLMVVPVFAQAVPRLLWDQPGAVLADVQTYTYTMSLDGVAVVTPLAPTCKAPVAPATNVSCFAPIATMTPGVHTVVLVATNAYGTTSSDPLVGGPPNKPTNVRITFTVTIP